MALTDALSASSVGNFWSVVPTPEFQKAAMEDMLRPDPKHRAAFVSNWYHTRRRYGSFYGNPDQRLMDTAIYDPELFAMFKKAAEKTALCSWSLKEREGMYGKGKEKNRKQLEWFYHVPDGEFSYPILHFVIAFRLKVLGECYLRLMRSSITGQMDDRTRGEMLVWFAKCARDNAPSHIHLTARSIETALVKAWDRPFEAFAKTRYADADALPCNGFGSELTKAAQSESPDDVLGFEALEGTVIKNVNQFGVIADPERAWTQIVGFGGARRDFPDRDIIPYVLKHPGGGTVGLSEAEVIERFSDSSLITLLMQRDFTRTLGRAYEVIMMKGFSEVERARFYADLLRRADPASADEFGVPMLARTDASSPDADLKSVKIGATPEQAMAESYLQGLFNLKQAVTDVYGQTIGRTEKVNRANLQAIQREVADHINWLNKIIGTTHTDRIHANAFGIMDWVFSIAEYDPRPVDVRNREAWDKFDRGATTLRELLETTGADRWTIEALPPEYKDVRTMNSGGQRWLLATWLTQQLAMKRQTEMQMEQAENPPMPPPVEEPAAPEPEPSEMEAEGDGQQARGATTSPLRRALSDTLRKLQAWEYGAVDALRSGAGALTFRRDLAEGVPSLYSGMVTEALPSARTVKDVNAVFRQVKARARKDYEDGNLLASDDDGLVAELWQPVEAYLRELELEAGANVA